MRKYVPFVGDRKAREAWDKVFSREVLGAMLVSTAIGKVIEKIIVMIAPGTSWRLVAWFIAACIFVTLFVYWHRLEEEVDEKKEEVKEKADEVMDD